MQNVPPHGGMVQEAPHNINAYHTTVLGKGVEAFSCKDLISGKRLSEGAASQVTCAYNIPINKLKEDFESICQHMPYNAKPEKLVGDWEGMPFNFFLSCALWSHPTSIITSLRKMQDQIHIGGFLAALQFGLNVTQPCLHVSGNPLILLNSYLRTQSRSPHICTLDKHSLTGCYWYPDIC